MGRNDIIMLLLVIGFILVLTNMGGAVEFQMPGGWGYIGNGGLLIILAVAILLIYSEKRKSKSKS